MPRNLNSSLMKPFVVLAIPGMYLFYKYNQYKRQQQEQNRRKVTERELAHLNHKIDKLLAKLEEHEPEQATNQEEECVICITAKATMQTYPCGHRVVCRKCFVKTIQTAVAQRMLPLRCVICRAKILRLKQSGSGGGGGMSPSPSTSSSLSSASSFSSFSVHSSASTFSLKSYKSDSTCSSRSSVSSVVSAISSVSSAKSVKSAKSSSSTAAQGPSTSQAHPSSSAKGCSPSARTSPATANKNANKSGGKQGSKEAKKLHHHNHHNHHHHHGHHQEHKTDANVKDAPTPTKSSKEKMSLPGRKGRSSHKSSQSLPTAKVRSRSPHKLKLQPHRLEIIKEVE